MFPLIPANPACPRSLLLTTAVKGCAVEKSLGVSSQRIAFVTAMVPPAPPLSRMAPPPGWLAWLASKVTLVNELPVPTATAAPSWATLYPNTQSVNVAAPWSDTAPPPALLKLPWNRHRSNVAGPEALTALARLPSKVLWLTLSEPPPTA